jgi:hypothetical protein
MKMQKEMIFSEVVCKLLLILYALNVITYLFYYFIIVYHLLRLCGILWDMEGWLIMKNGGSSHNLIRTLPDIFL